MIRGTAVMTVLFAATVFAQETTDKRELRFKFEKGEKLTLKVAQKMNAKVSEAPDFLKDMMGEEPFDLDFSGTADLEVKDIDADGKATLEGRFAKMTAKGNVMVNEIDYSYDREKDGDKPAAGGDEGGDEGMPGMPNMEDEFAKLATSTLKITIDKFGKISFDGQGGSTAMAMQLLNISALVGVLPKDKVGKGDSWKNDESLSLPGMPIKMKVKSTNKFDKIEKKGDTECIVIKSEFAVGSESNEEDAPAEGAIPLQGKFTGTGDGTMYFDPAGGRPVENKLKLDTKFDFTMPNPQGGDDLNIKGTFTMSQTNELKKAEKK